MALIPAHAMAAAPSPTAVEPVDVPARAQTGGKPPRPVTERSRSLGAAVTSPLEDLNLKRVDIPEVLQHAVEQPYDVRGLNSCRAVATEIGKLDAALGPDRDEPAPDRHMTAGSAAVELVRAGAEMATPYRGWIRKLSGANRHQAKVREAINAGGARRGYLKGVGMRMNCAPPAAPSGFKPARMIRKTTTVTTVTKTVPAQRSLTIPLPSWWPR
ncbi:MAG: hypothetical protein B7Y99_04155 [Caulobacterales bacterium 32-69-10]|nr:MAG: hypothetical protein B7Y99_04155 [Caulobacterales bacterium 32-69-10]